MTDNEILKALECHSETSYNQNACERCPILNHCDCGGKMAQNAFDLITRQKAELEEKSNKLREVLPIVAELRAEAIKEFAERLKEQKYQSSDWSRGEHPFVVEESDIDELVQEMVGDEDG